MQTNKGKQMNAKTTMIVVLFENNIYSIYISKR